MWYIHQRNSRSSITYSKWSSTNMIVPFVYFFRIDFTLIKHKSLPKVFSSINVHTCCWVRCEAASIEKRFFFYCSDRKKTKFAWIRSIMEIEYWKIVPHRHTCTYLLLVVILDFGCMHCERERDRNKYTKQSTPSFVRLFVLRWSYTFL